MSDANEPTSSDGGSSTNQQQEPSDPEPSFIQRAYQWVRRKVYPRRIRAIALGLNNCGKTTLLNHLQTGEPQYRVFIPTVVAQVYDVEYKDAVFQFVDTCGYLSKAAVWQDYMCSMDAVIFVIDATERAFFQACLDQYRPPLDRARSEGVRTVLYLINKVDGKHVDLTATEAAGMLGLPAASSEAQASVGSRDGAVEGCWAEGGRWRAQACSGMRGEGLAQAIEWLWQHTGGREG